MKKLTMLTVAVLGVATLLLVTWSHSSDAQPAHAGQPPTPTKPNNDGNLSGIYDNYLPIYDSTAEEDGAGLGTCDDSIDNGGDTVADVADPDCSDKTSGAFHCIVRLDHDAATNEVKTASQCYTDFDTRDPNSALPDLPGEGPDPSLAAGPPPPLPYVARGPAKGSGAYEPGTDTLSFSTCSADVGGTIGPNIISSVVFPNAKGQLATIGRMGGEILFYPPQSISQCDNLAPDSHGQPAPNPYPFQLVPADPSPFSPVSWRGDPTDFDGDGCTDFQELDKTGAFKCGDDPYNPLDSNQTDYGGSYNLLATINRADWDKVLNELIPGYYIDCLADVQQDGDGKAQDSISARIYCYVDNPSVPVNPQVESDCVDHPEACGDGLPGAAPPVPFGDVDDVHTVLTGQVNNIDNTIELSGCFEDRDGQSPLGHMYWELAVDAHTGNGTVDIYSGETQAACLNGTPEGSGDLDVPLSAVRQADKTVQRDTDGDGCPDKAELTDNPYQGGLRDPFNRWDYFEPEHNGSTRVADILTVVNQYFKDKGHPDYTKDTDRTVLAGGNAWNLGPPNGQQRVDDILAIVTTYFHDCPGGVFVGPDEPKPTPTQGPTPTPPAPSPGLDFSIGIDTDGDTTDDCDSTAGPTYCALPLGSTFQVKAYLNSLPVGVPDYEAYEVVLGYTGVSSKENVTPAWPDCIFPAAFFGPGIVAFGCTYFWQVPPPTYTGLMATSDFNCDATGTITMTHGPGKTNLLETVGSAHHEGGSETLTISCLSHGGVAVDALGDDTSASDPVDSKRNVAVGTPFLVTIHGTESPLAGGGGYQAYRGQVRWDEPLLDYLPAASAADENVWPQPCTAARAVDPDDDLGKDAAVAVACVSDPAAVSTYTGPVTQLQFVCQEEGSSQLSLVPLSSDPVNGTMFVDAEGGQTGPSLTSATINCIAPDGDSDGMPDYWEDAYACTDSGVPDDTDDDDTDGQDHLDEFNAGTNPCDPDTDDDGLTDGEELKAYFTDPLTQDTDGDGLSDDEMSTHGTDPNDADSDDDGLNDGFELSLGTFPTDPDSDDDTHEDGDEWLLGSNPSTSASTPEHFSLPATCTDTLDNDQDGDTDELDGDCAGFPPPDVDVAGVGTAPDGTPQGIRGRPITIEYTASPAASNATITITGPNPPTVGPDTMTDVNGDGTLWRYIFTPPYEWPAGSTPIVEIVVDSIPLDDFGILLIDPSGTVFESDTLDAIIGAIVRLFRINPGTGSPQEMDPTLHAGMFSPEENPQTSGEDGRYAWDVAPGDYFVRVSKPGCSTEDSSIVTIPPAVTDLDVGLVCPDTDSDGIKDHLEIELGTSYIDADHDGDGCTEGQELGPDEQQGGRRDPLNQWDYFNPTQDGQNRVDDILAVVNHYFLDVNDPAAYATVGHLYDRTLLGPNDWNLGPPNGEIRVDDILHAIHSYFHDCALE